MRKIQVTRDRIIQVASKKSKSDDLKHNKGFRWVYLPYCLMPVPDHQNWFWVLNRHYKPLGVHYKHPHAFFMDYDESSAIYLHDKQILGLSRLGATIRETGIWLYSDNIVDNPDEYRLYFARLEYLSDRPVFISELATEEVVNVK